MSRDSARTVVAIVIAVVLGGGALAYGGVQFQKVREIERGPSIAAHATDWVVVPARTRPDYRVTYAFSRAGSDHTGGPVRVPKDVYDRTRAGVPLMIRSAPDRPDWSLPADVIDDAKSDAAFTAVSGALVIVFVFTALVLMWAVKRRRAKAAV